MSIKTIKAAVKTKLDALVTDGVLAGANQVQIKQNPLNEDAGDYPHAYLMPPASESEILDNRSVTRTHTFDIVVVFQAEDLDDTAELEEKIEDMLDKFDNDPTLSGSALGGITPVSSTPTPYQHGGRDLIYVVLQIQAREPVSLSFS